MSDVPKVLKQYKVTLKKADSSDSITGDYPDNLGLRTKLGGKANWIQDEETPICPSCNKPMSFVGQIDSIEHELKLNPHSVTATSPEQEYMFGDVGMLYLFFCFNCAETKSIFQSY